MLRALRELATFLGKPTSWVYDNHAKEGVPSFRVGQQLRFSPAEVRRWLEERCRVAT
ncbi:helix-turn-helix domain-containing protein [Streptomyces sp. NPDC088260]|uniref:helix-turn-helix domain-containing protein n=1 Tax=Streptomyces sp. NPDC088260 TaxID=3365850 RepID=UPI003828691A